MEVDGADLLPFPLAVGSPLLASLGQGAREADAEPRGGKQVGRDAFSCYACGEFGLDNRTRDLRPLQSESEPRLVILESEK